MSASLIDYGGFEDLDDHRFLWMALLHMPIESFGDGLQELYLTFDVQHPAFSFIGPAQVLRTYPRKLCLVLQHHYENLQATRTGLTVEVSFARQRAIITADYEAVLSYFDVQANFVRTFRELDASSDPTPVAAGNVVPLFPGRAQERARDTTDEWIDCATRRPPANKPFRRKLPWSDEPCRLTYQRRGEVLYAREDFEQRWTRCSSGLAPDTKWRPV